ncbi:MAG: hypothetical protein AAGK67_04115 [Pseudomonadota bacterium]
MINKYLAAGSAATLLSASSAFALTVKNTNDATTLAAATLAASSGITITGGQSLIGAAT